MNINFVKYIKFYYALSGILALAAIFAIVFFSLGGGWRQFLGIDLLGGSIIEFEFDQIPENSVIQQKLKDFGLGDLIIQPTDTGVIIRTKELDEPTHQAILAKLQEIGPAREIRFESIGSVIGQDLRSKTFVLVVVSLISLLVYIAVSFRKISRPISSWKYGAVSIITLTFDVLITIGIFFLLGRFYNVQFNIPIITALLTILGYTINDKVIVFDRIRENIVRHSAQNFDALVNSSLNQTIFRTISTGTCSLLVLFALFIFGGETLKYFSLALIIGIITGTYSSIFIASSLLITLEAWRQKRIIKKFGR